MTRARMTLCCHRERYGRRRYDCKERATHTVSWCLLLDDGQPICEKRLCERHALSLTRYLRRVGDAPSSVKVTPLDACPGAVDIDSAGAGPATDTEET